MGTITRRKNKDGSTKYTAQIRLRRQGRIVYQESRTFDFKQTAQAWVKLHQRVERLEQALLEGEGQGHQ